MPATKPTPTARKQRKLPSQASMTIGAVFTRRGDLGDELPGGEQKAVKQALGHRTFTRIEADGPVRAGPLGLDGSMEYQRSLRATLNMMQERRGDRAVLVQTAAHLRQLRAFAAAADPPLRAAVPTDRLRPGSWGENVFLDGGTDDLDSSTVCVGDQFEVMRAGTLVCRLQVASPRLPCGNVDIAFGETYTSSGVRAEAARTGMGGFFCRVLRAGTVQKGDEWRLGARPHPRWPLRRICALLYGNDSAVMRYKLRGVRRQEWGGTQEELEELAGIDELAVYEWRDELLRMLNRAPMGMRYRGLQDDDGDNSSEPLPPLALCPSARVTTAAVALAAATFMLVRQAAPEAFVDPRYANGEGGPLHAHLSTDTMLGIFAVALLVGWVAVLQAAVVLGRLLGGRATAVVLGLVMATGSVCVAVGFYLGPLVMPALVQYVRKNYIETGGQVDG